MKFLAKKRLRTWKLSLHFKEVAHRFALYHSRVQLEPTGISYTEVDLFQYAKF